MSAGRLLTVVEVAERLSASDRYVRRLLFEGRIAFVKLGDGKRSPVRIPEKALEAFIERGYVEAGCRWKT